MRVAGCHRLVLQLLGFIPPRMYTYFGRIITNIPTGAQRSGGIFGEVDELVDYFLMNDRREPGARWLYLGDLTSKRAALRERRNCGELLFVQLPVKR